MKRVIVFFLSSFLILFPSLSLSQTPIGVSIPGTGYRPWTGDINGVGNITDVFPREKDVNGPVNLLNAFAAAAGKASGGTNLDVVNWIPSSYIYGLGYLKITASGATAVEPTMLLFRVSFDGTNLGWPMNGLGVNNTVEDTVRIRLFGAGPHFIPIHDRMGFPLVYPYLGMICRHDSAAGNTITYTVDYFGRRY